MTELHFTLTLDSPAKFNPITAEEIRAFLAELRQENPDWTEQEYAIAAIKGLTARMGFECK